jgi:hypothetical protein
MSDQERDAERERGAKVFIAEVFRSRSQVGRETDHCCESRVDSVSVAQLSKTWCAFVIRNGVSFERLELPDR